jgi:CRISPR-associated protein Csb2
LTDAPPAATRIPGEHLTGQPLRVSYAGRLSDLECDWRAEVRPSRFAWTDYVSNLQVSPALEALTTVFDDQFVILRRTGGTPLALESTLLITKAMRGAMLNACPDPAPEWLSGHEPDGAASQRPHVVLAPLPHVGRAHADGHLLGLALIVPRGIPADEQRRNLGPLLFGEHDSPRPINLTLGKAGVWTGEIETGSHRRSTALRSSTWTGPARHWATVTPIVFDRHPRERGTAKAMQGVEQMIADSCTRIGLPVPVEVVLSPVSMFAGVPHSRRFPCLQRKEGGNRHHTHAVLKFEKDVIGPVLLGAGRYRGYGLCRPLETETQP